MIPGFLPTSFGDEPLITLPHPRTQKPNDFIIKDGQIYEVQIVDRPLSSYFIDNYALADGTAFFAYKVHPLFVVLPYMYGKRQEFSTKKDFFFQSAYSSIGELVFPYFEQVCLTLQTEYGTCYALDPKKMMEWLVGRCEKLLPYLKKKSDMDDNLLIEMSWGIVRHYLPKELSDMLKENIRNKYPDSFPQKTIDDELKQAAPEPVKKPPKKAARGKVTKPKGAQDISSFFAPVKKPNSKKK